MRHRVITPYSVTGDTIILAIQAMRGRDRDVSEKARFFRLSGSGLSLIGRAPAQQISIAMFGHPFGSRQMAIMRMPRAFRFTIRVNMQNDPSDPAPVGAFGVSVKQAQVSHQMLLVVGSQRRVGWRDVGNNGIKRRVRHASPRQIFKISNVPLDLLEGINGCARVFVENTPW